MPFDPETIQTTLAYQQAQLDDARWRMTIAQQFAHMMLKAYDAFKAHDVDYTKLRSYNLWPTFEPPQAYVPMEGRMKMHKWIVLIEKDIDAAIRRKQTYKIIDNKDDPYRGD